MVENETRTSLFLDAVAQISFALGEVNGRLAASERARGLFTHITFECNIIDGELLFTALMWEDQKSIHFITCVVRGDGCTSVRYGTNEYSTEYLSPARALLGVEAFFDRYIILATREELQ